MKHLAEPVHGWNIISSWSSMRGLLVGLKKGSSWPEHRCGVSNSSTVLQNQLSYPASSIITNSFSYTLLNLFSLRVVCAGWWSGSCSRRGNAARSRHYHSFCSAVCFGGESRLGWTGDTSCVSTASHITKVVSRDFVRLWFGLDLTCWCTLTGSKELRCFSAPGISGAVWANRNTPRANSSWGYI